jgi:N-acetylglucosamine kinase-like BadF-type ATPase
MKGGGLLLAVNGAGPRTQAVVTDLEGRVLARGFGPPSNLHQVGVESLGKALTAAIEGALLNALGAGTAGQGAPWRTARIAAACFGLAGVDGPEDEAQVSRWVKDQGIAPRFVVVNDSELILAGGTPEGWGAALISGTGSVCLGRSSDGQTARVGGWGPLLGDEGSGYQMALRALRLATRTADGRAEAQPLLAAVLRHYSLTDAGELIRHIYAPGRTSADLADLAPVVVELGANGDAAARAIVEEAARELALQLDTVIRRLRLEQPPVAFAGNLLRGGMRQAVLAGIKSPIGAVTYVGDPCLGAVAVARRLLKAPSPPGG